VSKDTLERRLSNAGVLARRLKSRPNYLANIHVTNRTIFVCRMCMSTSVDLVLADSLHSHKFDHFHFIYFIRTFYTCILPVIMHYIQQVTHFIPIIFEAQLVYLATCFRSTSNSALSSRMNTIRMDRLTYVKDLKLAETQKLSVGLVDCDPHFDFETMLGKDFNTFSTKTEQMVWKGLTRAPLQILKQVILLDLRTLLSTRCCHLRR